MAEADQENNPAKPDSADEDTDEESEVLEESPCGRWQKRREEVCRINCYEKYDEIVSHSNNACCVCCYIKFSMGRWLKM